MEPAVAARRTAFERRASANKRLFDRLKQQENELGSAEPPLAPPGLQGSGVDPARPEGTAASSAVTARFQDAPDSAGAHRAPKRPRFTKSGPGASSGLVDRLFPQSQLLQPAPASTGTPRPQASESTAPQVGRGHGFSDVRGSPPRRSHAVARATRPAARVPTSPPRQSRVQQAVSSPGRRQLLAAQAAAIVPRADVKTTGTDVDAIPVLVRDVNDGSAVQEAGRSRQLADDIRYLLETVGPDEPTDMRLESVLKLAKLLLAIEFREHFWNTGLLAGVLDLLQDAPEVTGLALPVTALLLTVHHDPRQIVYSARSIALLLRVLGVVRTQEDKPSTGLARRKQLLQRRKSAKVADKARQILNQIDFIHPFPDVAHVTVRALALETLCSIFTGVEPEILQAAQQEFRVLGGLDKLVRFVTSDTKRWGQTIDDTVSTSDLVVVSRSLRCLLGAVRNNDGNRTYLACLNDSQLIVTLLDLVTACNRLLNITEKADDAGDATCTMLCEVLKVLLELTHNSSKASAMIGSAAPALKFVACAAVGRCTGVPTDFEHDLGSLATTLLINATEHDEANRVLLTQIEVNPDLSFVDALAQVALSKCTEVEANSLQRSSQDQTLDNVAGAYAAILLGCICRDNPTGLEIARRVVLPAAVPKLLAHLQDYIYFEQAAGMTHTSSALVQDVKTVFDHLQE